MSTKADWVGSQSAFVLKGSKTNSREQLDLRLRKNP
jgi:hypothetical protein